MFKFFAREGVLRLQSSRDTAILPRMSLILAMAAALTGLPGMARGTSPVMPEPVGVYGPGVVCHLDYGVHIGADEAAKYSSPRFGVEPFGEGWAINLETDYELPDDRRRPLGVLDVEGLGRATRIELVRNAGTRFETAPQIVYVLSRIAASYRVKVTSAEFDGSDRDRTLLRRIAPARGDCTPLRPVPDDKLEPVYWSPVLRDGPHFVCAGRIGFWVRRGEQYQMPWSTQRWAGARLVTRDVRITVMDLPGAEGRRGRMVDLVSFIRGRTWDNGRTALEFHAPAPAPSAAARGDVGAEVMASMLFRRGDEERARALASRLEIIAPDDARCRS